MVLRVLLVQRGRERVLVVWVLHGATHGIGVEFDAAVGDVATMVAGCIVV